jgi:hypothetical protein
MKDLKEFIKTTIREFLNENVQKNDIIFVRTKNFDNTGTINKLPYNGIQCWAIYENDLQKYIDELELWGGKNKDVEIIDSNGYRIFALNYPQTHKYVMGEIDELLELEPFDVQKHILRFKKQGEKSMLEYVSDMKYQIILMK